VFTSLTFWEMYGYSKATQVKSWTALRLFNCEARDHQLILWNIKLV
jgi:hypothetical protein